LRGFIINSNEDVAPPQRMFTGGFTLIELLLVISVLTVLFALVLPVISSSKRRAKVMGCGNNIRQFCLASQMYAQSNPRQVFANTDSDGSDDLSWTWIEYIGALKTYSCPETKNLVRDNEYLQRCDGMVFKDLTDNATYKKSKYGTSYEVFGFMGKGTGYETVVSECQNERVEPGVQKTAVSVVNYIHQSSSFGLKNSVPGAANIWLFVDADDLNQPNLPTKSGNHGESGVNVGMADGHVEWVGRHKFVNMYETSQDEGRVR